MNGGLCNTMIIFTGVGGGEQEKGRGEGEERWRNKVRN